MIALAKAVALAALDASGALALCRHATRRRLRILAYHGAWVLPSPRFGDTLFMPILQFRERIRWLANSQYRVLGLSEAIAALRAGNLPDRSVVITIDDGWQSTWSHMLPVLEEFRLPATIYVTTWYVKNRLPIVPKLIDWLHTESARSQGGSSVDAAVDSDIDRIEALPRCQRGEAMVALSEALGIAPQRWQETGQFHLMSPDQIRDAHARGFDIQLHTHRHRKVDDDPTQLVAEIAENRAYLADLLPGKQFQHFCYPSGGFDRQAPGVLQRAGIGSATLAENGLNPPGCNPWRLYRLLDGSSVSTALFSAWLSGITELRPRAVPGSSAHP